MDGHREVKLLCKRSVEVNEFGSGDSNGFAVLQAIELVLEHGKLLGVDLKGGHLRVDLFFPSGDVGFPAVELGLGDFAAA